LSFILKNLKNQDINELKDIYGKTALEKAKMEFLDKRQEAKYGGGGT